MLDAARVTTNFKAGGDFTKFLNRNGANFLNASVQGFNQQVRNIREANANGLKGWASLATKFAVAGLPAVLLNALLWDDDDDYEDIDSDDDLPENESGEPVSDDNSESADEADNDDAQEDLAAASENDDLEKMDDPDAEEDLCKLDGTEELTVEEVSK